MSAMMPRPGPHFSGLTLLNGALSHGAHRFVAVAPAAVATQVPRGALVRLAGAARRPHLGARGPLIGPIGAGVALGVVPGSGQMTSGENAAEHSFLIVCRFDGHRFVAVPLLSNILHIKG